MSSVYAAFEKKNVKRKIIINCAMKTVEEIKKKHKKMRDYFWIDLKHIYADTYMHPTVKQFH